jgi:hypothetical protein
MYRVRTKQISKMHHTRKQGANANAKPPRYNEFNTPVALLLAVFAREGEILAADHL